ncbi:MAG: hypothetical protein ACOCVC_09485, partial [Spirochaeta sp.]
TSGLPQGEDSIEAIAQGWLQKLELFTEKTDELDMESVEELQPDFPRGALLLTYSGSLLTIGPMIEDVRRIEYTSIGLRHDVPDSAESGGTNISAVIVLDEPARLSDGPIKQSSPIYRIAIHREELEPEEEERRLSSATQIISEGFADVNKTLTLE